jgi:hypothetical protein
MTLTFFWLRGSVHRVDTGQGLYFWSLWVPVSSVCSLGVSIIAYTTPPSDSRIT